MENCAIPLVPLQKRDGVEMARGDTIEVPPHRVFDPKTTDYAIFEAACCDPRGWCDAFGMLEALSERSRTAGYAKAVYVIGVEGEAAVAKIGVSADPLRRVVELQSSHYRRLFLHGVIFTPTRKSETVEAAILNMADEDGDRMCGEWVNWTPEDTLSRALFYALNVGIPVCDAMTWRDDMIRRTKALAVKRRLMAA